MMFIKSAPNSHGFVNPRDVETMWRDQFDWVYRELDYAVFPITIHPDVSGRPQVLLMLERFIEYVNSHAGVSWRTMEDVAAGTARLTRSRDARGRIGRLHDRAAPVRDVPTVKVISLGGTISSAAGDPGDQAVRSGVVPRLGAARAGRGVAATTPSRCGSSR